MNRAFEERNFSFGEKERSSFVEWPDGYPFWSFPTGTFTLPGSPCIISVDKIKKYDNILVLGERGAGSHNCLSWLKSSFEIKKMPWALIKGRDWSEDGIDIFNCVDMDRRKKTGEVLSMLNTVETDQEFAQILWEWAKAIKQTCHLVFFKLHPAKAKMLADAMRSLREKKSNQLKVIIFSVSEDAFMEHALQSGYIDLCKNFRLPRLNTRECQAVLSRRIGIDDLNLSPELTEHLMKMTGGQVSLLKDLCEHLKAIGVQKSSDLDFITLGLAADKLMRVDLAYAKAWEEHLDIILKGHPEYQEILKTYLRENLDSERFPPSPDDRPLYTAGWLGLDHNGNWGIVSEFHKNILRRKLSR